MGIGGMGGDSPPLGPIDPNAGRLYGNCAGIEWQLPGFRVVLLLRICGKPAPWGQELGSRDWQGPRIGRNSEKRVYGV